jgi:hypothetical protein
MVNVMQVGEIAFKIVLTVKGRPIYCPGKNVT